MNPGWWPAARSVFELMVPVWETAIFSTCRILMTAKFSRERRGGGELTGKQTVLYWSPCRVSENHHSVSWTSNFQWKMVFSGFFCLALPCGFLMLILLAPTLLCRPGNLPSQSPMDSKVSCLMDPLHHRRAGSWSFSWNGATKWELSNGKRKPGVTGYLSCSTQDSLHQHFQIK